MNDFKLQSRILHSPLSVLTLRFLGLILIFSLSRLTFFLFNSTAFPDAKPIYFLAGIRFDVAMLLIINIPYFIFMLLPFNFISSKLFRTIGNWYLGIVNSLALLVNLIDTCYYPFSMRRMTMDIFAFIGETNNFGTLVPVFLKDYFYMIFVMVAFICLVILLIKFTDKIDYQRFVQKNRWIFFQIGLRLVLAFGVLTGMRGGWQLRPLNPAAAAETGGIENAALILNSPYSLIGTTQSDQLEVKKYFSDEECSRIFNTRQNSTATCDTFPETENIVIIILEGISSEYSDYLADEPKNVAGYTPFLDSLAQKSIVFRGFANGQHSIEAVSSILGGIPSLMDRPFVQSRYATNRITYPIPILKKHGYNTSFYHGGMNGTMGFDRCCKVVGIDQYYGMNEYTGNDDDYDGSWGIADIPYLQYVANELNQKKRPFFSTIFTLSSHHPFVVPKAYDNKVKKGDFPMQHTVAYTDLALRQFFSKVSTYSWFKNTLFVIVSDHTTFDDAKDIDFQRHRYSVPIIFFHPQLQKGYRFDKIMQQVDIMPSIMAYCGIEGSFASFGQNVFDEQSQRFAINYLSGTYEFYFDHYLVEFDGENIKYVWDLSKPAEVRETAPKDVPGLTSWEKTMKAVIQQFNNGLIDNKLMVNE